MRIRYQHGNLRRVDRKTGPACWELDFSGGRTADNRGKTGDLRIVRFRHLSRPVTMLADNRALSITIQEKSVVASTSEAAHSTSNIWEFVTWNVEMPFHRQLNIGGDVGHCHHVTAWWRFPHRQSLGLNPCRISMMRRFSSQLEAQMVQCLQ